MNSAADDGSVILSEFFHALDVNNVRYCVVGNTAELPRIPANDVDLVCEADDQATVRAMIDALATRFDGNLAQVLRHEANAYYHVLRLRSGSGAVFLKIDVCTDYVIEARPLLSANWLVEGRRKIGDAGFYTCAAEREFAYYLMKKVSKGSSDGKALDHLAMLFAEAPDACRSVLASIWNDTDAGLIEAAVVSKDWAIVRTSINALRQQMQAKHPRRLSIMAGEWLRVLGRLLQPTGFVIAVLGPDGSGKSTLLDALERRLAPLGRSTVRYHLKPPLGCNNASGAPVTDPHAKLPRGAFLSTLKLFYLAGGFVAGWFANVWWRKRRSAIVLFDRYYDDILADPRRYRNGAPSWIVRLIGWFVPRPDLYLVLDVDAEVARARKAEVSLEEARRQRVSYSALAASLPNAKLIDANQGPENVASDCEDAIVEAMARRVRERGYHAS